MFRVYGLEKVEPRGKAHTHSQPSYSISPYIVKPFKIKVKMFSEKVDMIITHILYPSNKEFPKEQTPSLHTWPDIVRKEKEAYFHGESGQQRKENKCFLVILYSLKIYIIILFWFIFSQYAPLFTPLSEPHCILCLLFFDTSMQWPFKFTFFFHLHHHPNV